MSRAQTSNVSADSTDEASSGVEIAWDDLRGSLSPALLTFPIRDLDVPVRMQKFAIREGIRTVEELVRIPHDELRTMRHIGRVSISRTLGLLSTLHRREREGFPIRPTLQHFAGIFELWQHQLERLRPIERFVLGHRAGLEGPRLTLQQLGDMLKVTRERARQLECRGLTKLRQNGWWIEDLEARLMGLLDGGVALPLSEVESVDPFFAGVSERWRSFAYFLSELGFGRLHLIDWNDRPLLTSFPKEAWNSSYSVLVHRLREATFPIVHDRFEELVNDAIGELSPAFRHFWDRLLPLLWFSHDDEMIVGFGRTRSVRVAAHVLGAEEPVPVSEIIELFGNPKIPGELIFIESGVVGAPHHLPEYELWAERLPPLCAKLMRRLGRERQTTTRELVEILRERGDCPPWLNAHTLSAILRRSREVRHLGGNLVTLPKSKGERLQVRELVISILEEAGRPLPTSEIIKIGSERRGLVDLTLRSLLPRAPFIETRRGHFGLIERDLPGGLKAREKATEALYATLERRRRGLFPVEAVELVRALSPKHRRWSIEMVRAAARHDRRLRLGNNGSVGLSRWGALRVPNRREFIAKLLEKHPRGIEITRVVDCIEAKYGERPNEKNLYGLAFLAGARRQNGWYLPVDAKYRPREG